MQLAICRGRQVAVTACPLPPQVLQRRAREPRRPPPQQEFLVEICWTSAISVLVQSPNVEEVPHRLRGRLGNFEPVRFYPVTHFSSGLKRFSGRSSAHIFALWCILAFFWALLTPFPRPCKMLNALHNPEP